MSDKDIPPGSQQAISAAAMTLVAVLVAFVGFAGYNLHKLREAWHITDLA